MSSETNLSSVDMKFVIGKEIGRGGFGIVNLASDDDGNKYAIKKINLAVSSTEGHTSLRNDLNVRYDIKNRLIIRTSCPLLHTTLMITPVVRDASSSWELSR